MSGVWKRTFEIAAPVERVWRGFTDPDELAMIYRRPGTRRTFPLQNRARAFASSKSTNSACCAGRKSVKTCPGAPSSPSCSSPWRMAARST